MSYKLTIEWKDPKKSGAKKSYFDKVESIGGFYPDKELVAVHFTNNNVMLISKNNIKAAHLSNNWEG